MSAKDPFHHTLIEAWKLAEQSRKASGMFAPRRPQDLFETKADGHRSYKVRTYKITLWLKAPHYVDVLKQKMAERYTGSLTGYLHSLIERSCPPTAPRPEPRTAKRERVLAATKLRNGQARAY